MLFLQNINNNKLFNYIYKTQYVLAQFRKCLEKQNWFLNFGHNRNLKLKYMAKKITRVEGGSSSEGTKTFVPTKESKAKSKQLRLFAILAWIVAIGLEGVAIWQLNKFTKGDTMTVLIILIVGILILAVAGSLLWKKANRLDPASKKEKVKFFIQNQLGLIISIIAFLPLIILIFTNKEMDGKQKGIAGAVAIVALVIAGIFGIDFNPPSVEEYTAQTQEVEELTGNNFVYWTKFGKKYHIYSECHHINRDETEGILEGTVAQARELKNITELCKTCKNKALKAKEADTDVDTDADTEGEDPEVDNEETTSEDETTEEEAETEEE